MRKFILFLLLFPSFTMMGADIFGFYAPAGSQTLNAAFEREAVETFTFQIEHDGVGISDWFVTVDQGQAPDYTARIMNSGTDQLNYQVTLEQPPSAKVLKAPPETLTVDNVVTSSDFSAAAAGTEILSFSVYFQIPADQFVPAGEYSDTLLFTLYTGDYSLPGTHVQTDQFSLNVTGRMAESLDIYYDREPGIRSLDLVSTASDKLIAVVHERSNASLGYTVSLTSDNFSTDAAGHTEPYFKHETMDSFLTYTLKYGGLSVTGWSGGTAVITDTSSTTASATNWLDRDLTLSYTGDPGLPSGYYEDRLIVTIQAK